MEKMITEDAPEIMGYSGKIHSTEWEELLNSELMPAFLGSYLSDYFNSE
jgi:hypothetical protein